MALLPENPRVAPPDWEDFSRWAPVRPAPLLRLISLRETETELRERDAAANRLSRPSPYPLYEVEG